MTSVNMRPIHQRVGMMFTMYARKKIDQKHGWPLESEEHEMYLERLASRDD